MASDFGNVDDTPEWEIISPDEIHENTTGQDLAREPFLDFRWNTRFGQFSFVAHTTTEAKWLQKHRATSLLEEPRPVHQQEDSPLFKLPTEIRLYIYELLMSIPAGEHGVALTPQIYWKHSAMSVLMACSRVFAEAEPIFYAANRLSTNNPDFLSSLCVRRRNAITAFTLPVRTGGSALADLQHLRQLAPNVKSLYLWRQTKVKFTDVKTWKIMVPQLVAEIEKMEELKELRVLPPEGTVEGMTGWEVQQKWQIEEYVDARLCRAVKGGSP